MSYNPFDSIETRLTNIEKVLVNLSKINNPSIAEFGAENEEQPIFVTEAAKLLGYKESTIRTLCHKKTIPHSKKGKLLRFYKSQLLEWVNSGQRKTQEEMLEAALNTRRK